MLQLFRNFFKSKLGVLVTLGFLALIALAFASSDVANSSLFGGVSGGDRVAVVGDERINSADRQDAWHADLRLARRFKVIDEIAIFGGVTNAAAASTTGAFKSRTAGLSLRVGL
jgi:hypothetical protein